MVEAETIWSRACFPTNYSIFALLANLRVELLVAAGPINFCNKHQPPPSPPSSCPAAAAAASDRSVRFVAKHFE